MTRTRKFQSGSALSLSLSFISCFTCTIQEGHNYVIISKKSETCLELTRVEHKVFVERKGDACARRACYTQLTNRRCTSLSYLDHNFEEIVTLEHVADLLAVGVLAHQFDEGPLGGVVAAVQTYPDDPQPFVRLDHLLLRLPTCLGLS